jgi:hypothetical protein
VRVAVVVFGGSFGAEVLELVISDGDDFFTGEDAFDDFHEVAGAQACDDIAFLKMGVVVFDKNELASECSQNGSAGNGDDGLRFAQGDAEVSAEIRAQAVVGIRNRGVDMESGIVHGMACIQALEGSLEFLAGKNIESESGRRAHAEGVEFWGLEDETLREEFGVIADFDKAGFRREGEARHAALADDMAGDRRDEGLRRAADSQGRDADDGFSGLDVLAEFDEHLEHPAGEWRADGAVFFRRNDKGGGDLNAWAEFQDFGFGGLEAQIPALGLAEMDRAADRGGTDGGAMVVARACKDRRKGKKEDGDGTDHGLD